jgi:eukaryotic-like serine/threonine-protein kinase
VNAEPALVSRIGKYEVVRVIGSGGGGVVYEAMHPELKKRVAVKTLHPKLAENPEALRRFLREGEAASRIRHPHVVDIHDVGVHEGQPFLVMELLEGRDLKAFIAERGALPLTEAVDLMLPVIAAVGAGHDAGVIHRDLKPHNVFIASGRGVGSHPKVLDFGVSKLLDANPSSISWSGVEVMVGTLCYMAPEQVRGSRHLDERVDQYALGLILYECLTGARVHGGEDQVAIIRRISEGTIEPPSSVRPGLPPSFETALMRSMATRPDDRYASVYEFGRALLPFASHRARMVWKTPFDNLPSTQRRPVVSGATVDLGDAPLTLERRPRTATLQPSGPRATRRKVVNLIALATVPMALGAGIAALLSRRRRAANTVTVPTAPVEPTPRPRGTAIERIPSPEPATSAPPQSRSASRAETEPAPPSPSSPTLDEKPASAPPRPATAEDQPERRPEAAPPAAATGTSATQAVMEEPRIPPASPSEPAPPRPAKKPARTTADPPSAPARTEPSYRMGANKAPIIPD